MNEFKEIIRRGKFYFPASNHYVNNNEEIIVNCDRCKRTKLLSCIGYKEFDLCLNCADIIIEIINNEENIMELDNLNMPYDPLCRENNIKPYKPLKKMGQHMFKKTEKKLI